MRNYKKITKGDQVREQKRIEVIKGAEKKNFEIFFLFLT